MNLLKILVSISISLLFSCQEKDDVATEIIKEEVMTHIGKKMAELG